MSLAGKFIAIEGNIGSGKTTLAHVLARRLNARLLLEEFEDNPFLTKFYENPQRYAFSLEMSFLADRYHQLQQNLVEDLFQPTLIADYAPWKSLIFAQCNLGEDEFKLYRQFWEMSLGKVAQPDLIVYLRRPIRSLQANIALRGRPYEQGIAKDYLKDIGDRYENFFRHRASLHLLPVEADRYNWIKEPDAVEPMIDQLKAIFDKETP
jgi:deoxyadenosine/deoxycytidine kinase